MTSACSDSASVIRWGSDRLGDLALEHADRLGGQGVEVLGPLEAQPPALAGGPRQARRDDVARPETPELGQDGQRRLGRAPAVHADQRGEAMLAAQPGLPRRGPADHQQRHVGGLGEALGDAAQAPGVGRPRANRGHDHEARAFLAGDGGEGRVGNPGGEDLAHLGPELTQAEGLLGQAVAQRLERCGLAGGEHGLGAELVDDVHQHERFAEPPGDARRDAAGERGRGRKVGPADDGHAILPRARRGRRARLRAPS
jgi:hypothetical protein